MSLTLPLISQCRRRWHPTTYRLQYVTGAPLIERPVC
jgi:hypothetical protein